jgi:2-oxoglutarate/2-oxoacid ferredoxin oxidoreductase subunit alpha
MEKTILIGGEAGQGSAVTSRFIAKVFCRLGFFVFNYRDYPSLIRGGHNFNVLHVSDRPVYSHKEKYDVILALDQKTIDLHQKNLKAAGIVFAGKKAIAKKLHGLDMAPILAKLGGPKILENDILIGAFFKYLGVDKPFVINEAKIQFGGKSDLIAKAIEEGYNLAEEKEKLKSAGQARYFLSGAEGVGMGALAAGVDVYFGYPMTPATSLMSFLGKKQNAQNILVCQLENEIAVANAAIGASYAGAKTMIGSSGGGFALMTEAMSLDGMAEIPLVVYMAQRSGPSTGVPTYTSQGDLKFVLNCGHGEFSKIVIAPGDPQECAQRTQEAFYLSSKYNVLSFVLTDKHLSECEYSLAKLEKSKISNNRFLTKEIPQNFKSYKITPNGVSPRGVPGAGGPVRASSYEHNEFGNTVEDAKSISIMTEKRLRKDKTIAAEVLKLDPVSVYGSGKKLIVSWGSTKGAIIDALKGLKGYKFLQISYINPFPTDAVKREIKKAAKVILVENNSTGLLGQIIKEQTGIELKNKILRYDGRPFTPDYLIEKLKLVK